MNEFAESNRDLERGDAWAGLSDEAVVRDVVGGRTELFEALVRRHNQRLYRVGRGYLSAPMDVEDAMQNTYLKAFKNLGGFRGDSAVSTWLTRIMVNECLMRLRKISASVEESIEGLGIEGMIKFQEEGPRPGMDQVELKGIIERSVSKLPRNYRVVYLLREAQNLSTAETARCLEISEENVKVRLHRAREALKSLLLESASEMELFEYLAPRCDPFTARVMGLVGLQG